MKPHVHGHFSHCTIFQFLKRCDSGGAMDGSGKQGIKTLQTENSGFSAQICQRWNVLTIVSLMYLYIVDG